MIVVLKQDSKKELVEEFKGELEEKGFELHESLGKTKYLFGLIGDTSTMNVDWLLAHEIVERVAPIQEPYKLANRKMHEEDTALKIDEVKIGGGHFQVIAGPCSIESREQMVEVAQSVKECGAGMLRGGAFKPRTSPYSFQGLEGDGLELLLEAKKESGLPVVTEIMSASHLPLFEHVDVIQVGARNMQNFDLLKEVGKTNKTILLKRGLANTLEELIMSAEYIMAEGNTNVILCERGIRTFETATRNTLDISAIPVLKKKTHLPVVVDPSHACGHSWMVEPLAMAAVAAGADGLMIEVHNNPEKALCDGAQSLKPDKFEKLMEKVSLLRNI